MQKKEKNKLLFIGLIVVAMIYALIIGFGSKTTKGSITYTQFWNDVKTQKIEKVSTDGGRHLTVTYKEGLGLEETKDENGKIVKLELNKEGRRVESIINPNGSTVLEKIAENGVEIEYMDSSSGAAILVFLMLNVPMFILTVVMIMYFLKMFNNFGGSRGKNREVFKSNVLFSDVAGMTEEKEELIFAIKSLQNLDSFVDKGVKPVKGILLEGPPGVGKTLLAKAVAGEAGVNFLSCSGSDFVEMFVGMGASRVRKLYKQAEELKPCVLFIDEIDALGRKRTGGGDGGTQEAEQTLLALLERMDGVGTTGGILFIGATNRADALDSALLRPGRFDKVIHIGPPKTKSDREAIVEVHTRDKTFAEGVTVEQIAKHCYGLTGAEIAATLNDAVMESFRADREGIISLGDIDRAVMKLAVKGLAKGRHTDEDRKRVAIHEAGHAIMNRGVGRDVVKVSIQPYSSGVGGVTVIDGDSKGINGLRKASDIKNDIKVLYAGKVAEELMLGECSVGASNDLERATFLLREYVGAYGMQEGSILSLVGLAQENMMLTANEELLRKMEEEGQRLYKEVQEYLCKDEVKENLHLLAQKLEYEEVIYDLEEVIGK